MKALLFLSLTLASFSAFSADRILNIEGLKLLSSTEKENLVSAAVSMNGGSMLGKCNLFFLNYSYVNLYINDSNTTPLIIAVSNDKSDFLTLSTNDEATEILYGTYGTAIERQVNAAGSTLKRPILKTGIVIQTEKNCFN